MNEMRKLMEAVERAQSGTPVTESEMQTYDVEYTVTVNVPVKAEDEEQAEEKFFDYLFSNELQMDHNFGLDLGEVTITPQSGGTPVTESETDTNALIDSIVAYLAEWNDGEPIAPYALEDEGISELLAIGNEFDLEEQFEALSPSAMDYVVDQVHKQIKSLHRRDGDPEDLRRPGSPNIRPT